MATHNWHLNEIVIGFQLLNLRHEFLVVFFQGDQQKAIEHIQIVRVGFLGISKVSER